MNITAQFLEDLSKIIALQTRAANIDGIVFDEPDETKFTCTVQIPTTETLFYNVPLRVLISSQSSFIEIPKKGTTCVLTFRDMNESRPQILEVHECKKIICKIDNTQLYLDTAGFKIINGASGLKKTLSDLIDAINLLTVPTGTGPSGTPINSATFTNIKTDLNNYLT